MELITLVDQPNKLPTLPKIVQQLIDSFNSEDVSITEISRLLASDASLSAKLLRLANSAYFHVSRTVGTVDDALRMLGFVMVRNLVLSNGMVAAFKNTPGMDLQQFWRYNLYTACTARWLVHQASKNSKEADTVFTLAMMHAIGQLQMHAVIPEAVTVLDHELNVLDAARASLEKTRLGFHYGDVSAALSKIWNFPEELTTALQDIPAPLESKTFNQMAGWVHLGAWRARVEVLALSDDDIVASYPAQLAKRLNLNSAWVPALSGQALQQDTLAMPALQELTAGLDTMFD